MADACARCCHFSL